jgi:hypothetical protein
MARCAKGLMRPAVAAVLVALLACGAAPAAAAPATDLVVIAKLKYRHQEGHHAYSFRQVLLKGKAEIGTSRVRCERRSKRFGECHGTYRFADGAIKVADDVRRGTRNPTLRIAKGTGAFLGIGGTMHIENLNRHTSRNTFHFTQPDQRPVRG